MLFEIVQLTFEIFVFGMVMTPDKYYDTCNIYPFDSPEWAHDTLHFINQSSPCAICNWGSIAQDHSLIRLHLLHPETYPRVNIYKEIVEDLSDRYISHMGCSICPQ